MGFFGDGEKIEIWCLCCVVWYVIMWEVMEVFIVKKL